MATETRELTCINCPLGCQLTVTLVDGEVTSVAGNTCKRGDTYGRKEVTNPTRIVTTKLGGDGDRVSLGDEIGVGFSVKGRDRWFAELDYQRSDWASCGMDHAGFANVGKAVFSATASQGVRAGFSFVPNRNDIRYYYRRITYRGGAYWDQAYYKLDGNTINSFGLTFGVTLPVYYMNNGLSLGVDIGQRGSMQGNKVRERYVNFHIGLNMFEIWFLKPRYN